MKDESDYSSPLLPLFTILKVGWYTCSVITSAVLNLLRLL